MTRTKVGTEGQATTTRVKCVCTGEAYRNAKGQMLLHTTPNGKEICPVSVKGARP